MTTRERHELEQRIETLERAGRERDSRIEGLETGLANVVNGARIVAVSDRFPAAEKELTGPAWSTRGRDGEDVPTPVGAIPADHTGRCPACGGAIRLAELIVKAPADAENEFVAGRWCHAECAPEPETEAAA